VQVACCQFDIAWEDKQANYAQVAEMVERARLEPGTLLLLPEMFATGFSMNARSIAEPVDGQTAEFLSELAARHHLFVLGGAVISEPESGGRDRSAGEAAADDQTMTRFAAQLAGVTGPAGAAVGGAIVGAQTAASTATAVGSDLTNQMGVGHTSWHPDQTTSPHATSDQADGGNADQGGEADPPPDPTTSDQDGGDWGRPLEAIDLADSPDTDAGLRTLSPGTATTRGRTAAAVDGAAGEAAAVPILPA